MNKQLGILLFALLCALSGCSLEDDDKPETLVVAFATVENPNATPKYYVVLDDSAKLYTAETEDLADTDQGYPKNGRRVFIGYNVLEPASANNIKLRNLVYASINGMATGNTTGRNDRHKLEMLYPGGADYLNVLVSHNLASSSNSKYEVLLIKKDRQEEGTAYFDLIYSNNGNAGYDYAMSPICFDLSPLKEIYQDSVKLVIDTYEESAESSKSYTMKYKWQ